MKIKLLDNPGKPDDLIRRGDAITTIAEKEHTYPSSLWFVPRMEGEMSAREFLNARNRMCKEYAYGNCHDCPAYIVCVTAATNDEWPTKGVAIVQEWAKEHPEPKRKTYAEDFFEKNPNAPYRRISGTTRRIPYECRMLHYSGGCATGDCATCWHQEMEEQDE